MNQKMKAGVHHEAKGSNGSANIQSNYSGDNRVMAISGNPSQMVSANKN
jgi:hypothetical protein